MTDYYAQLQQAKANGLEYAISGIVNGEKLPEESPLSGEWSGSLTPIDVIAMACDMTTEQAQAAIDKEGDFILTDFCDYWEDGYNSAEWPYRDGPAITEATDAAMKCLAWSSLVIDANGEDFTPADEIDADWSDTARNQMRNEIQDFVRGCVEVGIDPFPMSPAQTGHDFVLTRNRHGAGFWDRGLGKLGDKLTEIAKVFGETYVFISTTGTLDYA